MTEETVFNSYMTSLISFKFVKSALQTKQIHDKPVVSRIIEFLKQQNSFKYEAIRANGINSRNDDDRTLFMANGYQYLESSPAIQICFLTKNALNRKGFKIIYPEEYVEGYVV